MTAGADTAISRACDFDADWLADSLGELKGSPLCTALQLAGDAADFIIAQSFQSAETVIRLAPGSDVCTPEAIRGHVLQLACAHAIVTAKVYAADSLADASGTC